jgi:hypothetical protein
MRQQFDAEVSEEKAQPPKRNDAIRASSCISILESARQLAEEGPQENVSL